MLRISSLALLCCLASSADAANLVPEPGFDQPDLASWAPARPDEVEIEWSPVDELGNPSSGSMRVRNHGFHHSEVRLCVPVVADRNYAFGASARLLAAGESGRNAYATIKWWTSTDCSSGQLLGLFGDTIQQLEESWGTLHGRGGAPPGAHSASLALVTDAPSTTAFEVLIDNAFVVEDATCVSTATALCLSGDRFLVTVEWATVHGDAGHGAPFRSPPTRATSGSSTERTWKSWRSCSTPARHSSTGSGSSPRA